MWSPNFPAFPPLIAVQLHFTEKWNFLILFWFFHLACVGGLAEPVFWICQHHKQPCCPVLHIYYFGHLKRKKPVTGRRLKNWSWQRLLCLDSSKWSHNVWSTPFRPRKKLTPKEQASRVNQESLLNLMPVTSLLVATLRKSWFLWSQGKKVQPQACNKWCLINDSKKAAFMCLLLLVIAQLDIKNKSTRVSL